MYFVGLRANPVQSRRMGISRSQLYAKALADFVVRHDEDEITAAMNRVLEGIGSERDNFSRNTARLRLRRAEW